MPSAAPADKDPVTFWRRWASRTDVDPDHAASLDLCIPLRAQQQRRRGQKRHLLEAVLPAKRRVDALDLRCGPGTWALALGHSHVEFKVGSVLDFPVRPYGLVVAEAVLQYVDDTSARHLLDRVRRCLSSDGVAYLRVPTSPRARTERHGRCRAVYRTLDEYVTHAREAGFDVEVRFYAVVPLLTAGLCARRPWLERAAAGLLRGVSWMALPVPFGIGDTYLALRGLGTPHPLALAVVARCGSQVVAQLASFVPLQAGTAEAGAHVLFTALGATPAHGLMVELVRKARALLFVAAGLGLLAWRGLSPPRPTVADAGEATS